MDPEGHSDSTDQCGPPYCTGQPDEKEEEEETRQEPSKTTHTVKTSQTNEREQGSGRAKTDSPASEKSGMKYGNEHSYLLILVVILIVIISK